MCVKAVVGEGPVPALFAWREPNHVAWPDVLNGPVPALQASEAGRRDERLSERVCVPRRPRTEFERDSCARDACGRGRLKQRIDANRSSEAVARFPSSTPVSLRV